MNVGALWNPPEGNDLIGVGLDGDGFGSSQSEVGQLEVTAVIDEEVLRLQVAMQNTARVTESQAAEELVKKNAYILWVHQIVALVQVLLQVPLLRHWSKQKESW